jgi:signal transduction histidine kinase
LHGRGEYEGTGVGLAVCRRITDRHGGLITAKSKPGEGSTFIIILPMHQPRNEAPQ